MKSLKVLMVLACGMMLQSTSKGGVISIDLDNATAGTQTSITIATGGIVNGSILFEGTEQFDDFSVGMTHSGLNLLEYRAGDITASASGLIFFNTFGVQYDVIPGVELTLGPAFPPPGSEVGVGIFSLDDVNFLNAPFPTFSGPVSLVTFQLQAFASNVTSDVDLNAYTVFTLGGVEVTGLDFQGGQIKILGNNIIPEPTSFAVWAVACITGLGSLRRRR